MIICATCIASGDRSSASQLQIFVEPIDGYEPVLDALNSAQTSILVEMYLMTDKNIINALENASLRGVKVKVILEDWAYRNPANFKAVMESLNSSGISVEKSSPAFCLTHEKTIVIDRKTALIMTLNQAHTSYTENREFGIIDYNADDIAEIVSVFEADWNRTVPNLSDSDLVWSPVNSRDRIISLIDDAEKSLEIENEEMQDKEVEDHIISAAKRGVNVRVVMSPSSSKNDANELGRDAIEKGGALVHLLKEPYIHAKLIIADGLKAFVGSENFSPASLDRNRELGILIDDPSILRVLSSNFNADWNSRAGVNLNSRMQIQKNHPKPPSPKKPKIKSL